MSETRAGHNTGVRDPEEIEREQQLLWVLGYKQAGLEPGSFYKALLEAALRADRLNLERLRMGFPLTVRAMERWLDGTLLKQYGLEP